MKLEEAIAEIKRRTDLVRVIGQTVNLKKHGPSYLGLCPFHAEKSPSFNVRPEKGYFKCFGCGASGDLFTFLEKQSGQLFIDIVKRLAGELGITLEGSLKPKANGSVLEGLEQDQTLFVSQLSGAPLNYLTQQRKYLPEFIASMGLGFGGDAKSFFNSRITIPIRNPRGQIVGFGGRIFGAQESSRPKYVNSSASEIYDKGQVLYGLYESLALIKQQKKAVVVEGYFDVMAFLAVGVPAVAPCGTSLTESHAELLKKYTHEVVLCFDQDAAGIAAQQKALLLFLSKGFEVTSMALKDKDPDALWQKGQGKQLVSLYQAAKDAVEVRIEAALQQGMGGVHERIQALQALMPFLCAHPDPLVNRQYVRLAAQILKEDEGLLVRSVLKYRPGTLPRPALNRTVAEEQVIWSDAEKLLFKAIVMHPELVRDQSEILETQINSDFADFVKQLSVLSPQQSLLELPLSRKSSVVHQLQRVLQDSEFMSRQDAELILDGWMHRISQKKKNAWLSEQHKRLLVASSEGNIKEVKEALKSQSGLLKKGWT